MSLINCKECGKKVSNEAVICPNCGVKINRSEGMKVVIIIACMFIVFWILSMILNYI